MRPRIKLEQPSVDSKKIKKIKKTVMNMLS
jgi:hypothetical protein